MFDISLEQDLAAEPVYSEIGNVSHEINYCYILVTLMLTKIKYSQILNLIKILNFAHQNLWIKDLLQL